MIDYESILRDLPPDGQWAWGFMERHEAELRLAHEIVSKEDEEAFAKEEIQPNTLAYSRRISVKLAHAIDEQRWDLAFQAYEMLMNDMTEIRLAMDSWRQARESAED